MSGVAPSGFHVADRLQVAAFEATGSIPGAAKVTHIGLGTLCCRLRPPSRVGYVAEYKVGWANGKQQTDADILDSQAYADGYRDAAEGRMKWHLAHCPNHGDHESGCHA